MSALLSLLAAAPALPLDKAGRYVAAAYVALVAAIVIYIGIMAVRVRRMSRELEELSRALDEHKGSRPASGSGEGDGP